MIELVTFLNIQMIELVTFLNIQMIKSIIFFQVHRLKDTWTYKMKQMLEDIMHGGKDSASAVMEKLREMRKREEL